MRRVTRCHHLARSECAECVLLVALRAEIGDTGSQARKVQRATREGSWGVIRTATARTTCVPNGVEIEEAVDGRVVGR